MRVAMGELRFAGSQRVVVSVKVFDGLAVMPRRLFVMIGRGGMMLCAAECRCTFSPGIDWLLRRVWK